MHEDSGFPTQVSTALAGLRIEFAKVIQGTIAFWSSLNVQENQY